MNPAQCVIKAGMIIETFAKGHNGGGIIGILNGHIDMLPTNHGNDNFQGVQHITAWQVENGFDGEQWNALGDKLWKILERESQCPQHPKP